MEPMTAEQIRAGFVNCTKGEAKRLMVPRDLAGVRWDDLDYFGWRDPGSPSVGAMALWRDGEPLAIALRMAPERSASKRQSMCSLCITFHNSADVALMVARRAGAAGREGNTVGAYLCSDLACSLYARKLKRPVRVQAQETLGIDDRVERLRLNLGQFVARVLS